MKTRSDTKRPGETKGTSSSKLSRRPQTSDEERRNTAAIQHETRIRTAIRTPKLKSPKCRNIVQTPGRDDVLCSQHFDSQVVVGWDCNSPDTLRGIKRISGSEQQDDVSDLVMRLIGEDGDDEIFTKRSTPPLLGVWREEQEDKLLDDNTTISHRLRRTRSRQRKKSGKDSAVSKDLLNKLSLALDKCNEEDEVVDEGVADAEVLLPEDEATKRHNLSDDLFNSESNNNVEVKISRTSSRLFEKKNNNSESKDNSVQYTDSVEKQRPDSLNAGKKIISPVKINDNIERNEEPLEDNWSDDELFEEDSFIVKATQLSCDTKKYISPVFGVKRKTSGDSAQPKSKCSRYTFQLGSDEEKETDSGREKFTFLQNKQAESSTSRNTGRLNRITKLQTRRTGTASSNVRSATVTASSNIRSATVTASSNIRSATDTASSNVRSATITASSNNNFRSNTVTSSISNRPPIYPVTSHRSSTTCNTSNPKSVQAFSGCAGPVPVRSVPSKDLNTPMTRQRGNVHNVVNNRCTGQPTSKPVNNQSPSACTNVSFKKHSSFSGTNSVNLASNTSRRRSISGDNFLSNNISQGTSVLKVPGNASCSTSVSSNTAKTYPAASRNNVITSSIKSVLPSCDKNNKFQTGRTNTAASSSNVLSSSSRMPAVSTSWSQYGARSGARSTYGASNVAKDKAENDKVLWKPVSSSTKPNFKELPDKVTNDRKRSSVGGFDTSLSDDLLCQLAEPDDMLDSQADLNVTITPVTHVPTTISSVKPSCIVKHSNNVLSSTGICHKSSVTNNESSVTGNSLNIVTSSVNSKQPVKQYKFKPSQRKSTSPTGNKRCAVTEKTTVSTDGSSAKTKGQALEQYSEDLFASDDDGDLLADDDGLTEPQILAMLDEVELLASQQQAGEKSRPVSDPVCHNAKTKKTMTQMKSTRKELLSETKCTTHYGTDVQGSEGQSEGKFRTSDHGTDLPSSQGQLAGSQGQLAGSQGQSSSQTKYSPEEIERKKREAMERRKRKLKNV